MVPCSRFRCGMWVLWTILAGCLLQSGCGRGHDEEKQRGVSPASVILTDETDSFAASPPGPAAQESLIGSTTGDGNSARESSALYGLTPQSEGDERLPGAGGLRSLEEPAGQPADADSGFPLPQMAATDEPGLPMPAASALAGSESEFIDENRQTEPKLKDQAATTMPIPTPIPERASRRSGSAIGGSGPMPFRERASGEGRSASNTLRKPGASLAREQSAEQPNARDARPNLSFELQPGEELWVISRPADSTPRDRADSGLPGCGALMAELPDQGERVPVPLKHTAVQGSIDGYIATVDVTQQFHNPWESKIEAVYVFPLPEDAAVSEFVMTVGERRIRGVIREREKAEAIYRHARSQGLVASLLTQQRPNVFTQKVANLEPGRQIDISIRYVHPLRYDGGEYEFVFPMVVGPRYNPPHTVNGIGAAAHGAVGSSGQQTEVTYLTPDQRSGHDISVALEICTGVRIETVTCASHAVECQEVSDSRTRVVLSGGSVIPNRDFVLRYRVAGSEIRTALMTQQDDHGQYFSLMVYPPADMTRVERSPMELVFVLDCSGSMQGRPLEQARAAVAGALRQLTPRDTFQIINFSSSSSQLGSAPVIADEQNLRKGLQYLNSLHGSGGTEMQLGLNAALDFPHDEGRFRLVTFLTDGFIGNEQEILETLARKLGASRIFSFGVGEAPNRFLLDRMAILGRGAVSYLSLNDEAADHIDHFFRQISHPALTDVVIDFGEMQVTDVYPTRLPDLFVGRPIVVMGRYTGKPSEVRLNGLVGTRPVSVTVLPGATQDTGATEDARAASVTRHRGIAAVWARHRIADLMMSATRAPELRAQVRRQVTDTALNYGLMSDFTAFVAVDSLSQTTGAFGTTVVVPVPVPEGVRYDTTVSN